VLATIQGDYSQAVKLGEEARQHAQARADEGNLMFASYVLTSAFLAQGRYQTACQAAQQAYSLASALNNRWFMAYCLNDLGNVARALEDYPEAQQHYWAGYALKQEFNDPEGMAVALNHLGHVALLQQNYSEAKKLFQQSLVIYQDIGDQGGLAACLEGLGMTAGLLNEDEAAQGYFQRALHITRELQLMPLTLTILASIGEWWVGIGRPQRGVELLALVQHHPAADRVTKDRAEQSLAAGESQLAADRLSAARQCGTEAGGDLEAVIAALQIELMVFSKDDTLLRDRGGTRTEPLTPRELEVLRLIADGLSNQEIASKLIIAVGTVKAHASSIYNKLGVNNRAQAVRRAIALNLL
jgi:ATP/maltotriose-dependent transcriptional regulator MalT